MALILRKQYPEFELYEFTEKQELTLDQAISEFENFEWDIERSKSEKIIEQHADPCIRLRNSKNQILDIIQVDADKFSLGFRSSAIFPRTSFILVHGKTITIDLIKIFESGDTDLLIKRFKTMPEHYENIFLVDLMMVFYNKEKTRYDRIVSNEEYQFEMNIKSLFYRLKLAFLLLFMPLCIWTFTVSDKQFELNSFLYIQTIVTLLALPGFILALNYWIKNHNWQLFLKRRENRFILIRNGIKEKHDKGDFIKRIRTESKGNAPWGTFEYTTLIKKDGIQIHLSNILISNTDIDKFFGGIEEHIDYKGLLLIRDKKMEVLGK